MPDRQNAGNPGGMDPYPPGELSQQSDDFQLLHLVQAGEWDAFGMLYERHAPAVFRFLFAHVDNRLDAEDLTEDVFLRVWRSVMTFRGKEIPFVAFLFRVARNALIDHYRRTKRSKYDLSLEEEWIGEFGSDPGEVLLTELERSEVREKLEQLPEDYRTVLLLRFMGDLTPDEAARVMGKTPGSIRVLQHRALAALRKLLER